MRNSSDLLLIVDDNILNLQLTAGILKEEGYLISLAQDGNSALVQLETIVPDLFLLDIMMPGMDGLELCRTIKSNEKFRDIPVIFLTAKNQTEDLTAGFNAGGVDYITKPFDPRELSLRISNILRRTKKTTSFGQFIQFGGCFFNTDTAVLYRNMQVVILTSRERDLLRILVKNANQIVSRQTLLLSNGRPQASERSVDVDVTRLRQKIEEDPRMPKYLKTIRGYGYQLVTDISYKKIVTGALA